MSASPLGNHFLLFLTISSFIILWNIRSAPGRQGEFAMKETYINQITEQLRLCDDLALLDLISQILDKSI